MGDHVLKGVMVSVCVAYNGSISDFVDLLVAEERDEAMARRGGGGWKEGTGSGEQDSSWLRQQRYNQPLGNTAAGAVGQRPGGSDNATQHRTTAAAAAASRHAHGAKTH